MKIKKIFTCALCILMLCYFTIPAIGTTANVASNSENPTDPSLYAVASSAFSITLPKQITIDGNTKSATYTITCDSYSEDIEYISVIPDSSFEMSQHNKSNIIATITQSINIFRNNDFEGELQNNETLSNTITGNINVPDLSAGNWSGFFHFNISFKEKDIVYTDFTVNADNLDMIDIENMTGDIVIPETFIYDDVNYKVNKIEPNTFEYRSDITSVTLPDTITEIGASAFNNCTSLKAVDLPADIIICDGAFQYCTSLESVNLEGITTIKNNAFLGCTNLTEITISDSTTIGVNAFQYCTSLKDITFEGTAEISDGAFLGCTGIESIVLPEGLKVLNKAVFYNCSNLVSVTLPSTLEEIGAESFKYCSILKNINIPNSVTTIRGEAFHNCSSLELTIPDTVTTIERNAFAYMQRIYYTGSATYEEDNLYWGAFNLN